MCPCEIYGYNRNSTYFGLGLSHTSKNCPSCPISCSAAYATPLTLCIEKSDGIRTEMGQLCLLSRATLLVLVLCYPYMATKALRSCALHPLNWAMFWQCCPHAICNVCHEVSLVLNCALLNCLGIAVIHLVLFGSSPIAVLRPNWIGIELFWADSWKRCLPTSCTNTNVLPNLLTVHSKMHHVL